MDTLDLRQQIQHAAAQALASLYSLTIGPETLTVQRTSAEHTGDYTLVLFPLMKHKLGAPEAIGNALGAELQKLMPGVVSAFSVVKGFLNLSIADAFWVQQLNHLSAGDSSFQLPALKGERVMVEFSSPNTNKPLHLGHLRNNFLGDAVSSMLAQAGATVVRANLVNDRGVHICKSMLAWQLAGGKSPAEEGLKGDHLVGKYYVAFEERLKQQAAELVKQGVEEELARKQAPIMADVQEMLRKWEANDPDVRALWQKMNGWVYDGFEETYRRMGIRFDVQYHESETYLLGKDIIEEGLTKGVFYRRPDGSVWADLKDEGLDEKVVLRSDGTSVYITQDLGTADLKLRDMTARVGGMERSVYVIGNEQDYHMKVLISILRRLGRPYAPGMYHLSYGMVELPSGKMKSREGTVVDADDLMAEVVRAAEAETTERGRIEGFTEAELKDLYEMLGMGALKFFLLKVGPAKKMLYDPQESVSLQGDTGPFVQYTHARIHSLLERARQQGYSPKAAAATTELHPAERAVVSRLYLFSSTLVDAANQYDPSLLAAYVLDLAKDYNRFYYEVPVLKEENPDVLQVRLALSQAVATCIRTVMGLLGIGVPNRM